MRELAPRFDPELVRRYDQPGPRYTSYPTAPQFTEAFCEADLRAQAAASGANRAPLSLYVHVPFCESPCFYCGCNRIITRERARAERYVGHLALEIERAAALFSRTRETLQLHFGGGTPNFLPLPALEQLVGLLGRHFSLSASSGRDFSIELDPRYLDSDYVHALAALGFNRASLGVQDFDPAVQEAINRVQGSRATLELIDACRSAGFRSVNVDLIYGLPRQTLAGFGRTLETVLAVRPERLAIYGYAHLPQLFKAQRRIEARELPDARTRLELLQLAVEELSIACYRYIGMDHFALPEDELSRAQASSALHRNFMGYSTHAECDLLGLGVSAISHLGRSFSQNARELAGWERRLEAGGLPLWRGIALNDDDVLRAEVIQQIMCRGEIDCTGIAQRHAIDFQGYFGESLARLQRIAEDGLVEIAPERITATPRGRFLLRILAMCFDRYLRGVEAPAAAAQAASAAGAPVPAYSRVL